ncbi:UDP-3-O-acyl-N-acetylglucosamine deacetylase [Pseudogemmobacter faecipullorum]|uniref:UDP-3-O-acyl-N-acetylglucosamine deacetylase n=1 Tax=Pseudogemmobacter faecipullorum TaxID=2755041 RepID=A0ABS8CLI7_9RHOB|nr:UDP-3-O-acyl-N-acetylglucosamine deacetylase [Pseudogemmobacter faecipullorum]
MQNTVKCSVSFVGVGLHTGRPVRMVVLPAPADHGIRFLRSDLIAAGSDKNAEIPAIWSAVTPSRLCTVVENEDGVSVSTIEHLMAAFAGMGIHNALVRIDGGEVPILDGSSEPFVAAFLKVGLVSLETPVSAVRVLRAVEVREGEAVARLEPAEMLEIDFRIEFEEAAIGVQERSLKLSNGAFVRELSDSRTFCRQSDVDAMRERGLALGGTVHNAVVFDGARVVSPGGLRHKDEPVRHKMLDAVGDLALAGGPILGRYTGLRAGHAMTNRLLRALFEDPANYRIERAAAGINGKLPGAGVHAGDLPSLRRQAA